jgi:hypothetical protein
MLGERPNRVYEALQYLLYIRETDHTRVKRSWAAYLAKLVDDDVNLSGDVKFQEWLARRRREVEPGPRLRAALSEPVAVERMPAVDSSHVSPRTVSATELWDSIRERVATKYELTHSAYVEDLVAYDLSGDTLTCVAGSEFALRKLRAAGLDAIEAELEAATDGRVTRLRLEPYHPERHAVPDTPR